MRNYNVVVDGEILVSNLSQHKAYYIAEKEVKRLRKAGFNGLSQTVKVVKKSVV